MADKHEYADINEKLRDMTPEQAKAFGKALADSNSVYIKAEMARKAKEAGKRKSGK